MFHSHLYLQLHFRIIMSHADSRRYAVYTLRSILNLKSILLFFERNINPTSMYTQFLLVVTSLLIPSESSSEARQLPSGQSRQVAFIAEKMTPRDRVFSDPPSEYIIRISPSNFEAIFNWAMADGKDLINYVAVSFGKQHPVMRMDVTRATSSDDLKQSLQLGRICLKDVGDMRLTEFHCTGDVLVDSLIPQNSLEVIMQKSTSKCRNAIRILPHGLFSAMPGIVDNPVFPASWKPSTGGSLASRGWFFS